MGIADLGTGAPSASTALADGAGALGWKAQEVPRWVGPDRVAGGDFERRTMSRTYLPRAQARGARVQTSTTVTRLLVERGRVRSAEAVEETPDGPAEIEIRGDQFFVSAGAIQTAALLWRSGLVTASAAPSRCTRRSKRWPSSRSR